MQSEALEMLYEVLKAKIPDVLPDPHVLTLALKNSGSEALLYIGITEESLKNKIKHKTILGSHPQALLTKLVWGLPWT